MYSRNVQTLRERVLILPHFHAVSITCRFHTHRFHFCTLLAVSFPWLSFSHSDSVTRRFHIGPLLAVSITAVSTAAKTSYTPFQSRLTAMFFGRGSLDGNGECRWRGNSHLRGKVWCQNSKVYTVIANACKVSLVLPMENHDLDITILAPWIFSVFTAHRRDWSSDGKWAKAQFNVEIMQCL